MRPADEFQKIADGLFFWQGYDAAVKADLCSTALQVGAELFFVDPIPLAKEALAELTGIATPAAVILTNGNHERAAENFRERFNIPVFAHENSRGEISLAMDEWLVGENVAIRAGLTAVHLPGAGTGEMALHAHRTLVVGDALINLGQTGFAFLPDKYCANPKQLRESARRLLALDFDVMTFAHGLPIVADAKRRLKTLLTLT